MIKKELLIWNRQKKTVVCTFTLWMNEGFCRINFFTKMVIVFLKSLIFERLSFRFLQQEKKKFCLKLKIVRLLRVWRCKLQFFLFCVFQMSSSFFIMLTARDVRKIVFWHNGYSDSSYKYFLLKKFIKDLMTCKNK